MMTSIPSGPQSQDMQEFMDSFIWFYILMGVMMGTLALVNLLSAMFLIKKQNRMFSLIVAGINCIQMPIGTILGIFTIIVLMRDSVRKAYENKIF